MVMDEWSSALSMDTHRERVISTLETAYAPIDGYAIARTEVRSQRDKGIFVQGAQYGEINARVFASALERLAMTSGETFVDLGSGTGKAVLTAAALYRLRRATGVEIQKPLHAAALMALESLTVSLFSRMPDVKFVLGDAFKYDWHKYDVVFVNAAVFTQEMLDQVDHGAELLNLGARILICTRPLLSPFLCLLWQEKLKTGKGSLLFRAYQRVAPS
jgi:precorrin-6B methylase 2